MSKQKNQVQQEQEKNIAKGGGVLLLFGVLFFGVIFWGWLTL